MRCYYEELGIARDSNDADIKSAYRKLALRWHPDKNPDCLDEAKEKFQLIQQAYEVLADQQERAWYDNHREQILRGKNSEYEEKSLDVFQYFTGSCYKGYGDDAQGFYSIYKQVFEKLASEDAEFMDDADEISGIPSFGKADSIYEDVVGPFYAYWQSYSTKKTYEWLCPYDILEIKDRYILRKVEKEMKKIVLKARKERNEEVRNLVSFIRKRDRRVHAYRRQLEERAELNRQKQEEKRKEQLRKRQQDLAAVRQSNSAFNEGYEEQLKQLEQEYGRDSEDEEEEYTDYDENSDGENDDTEEVEATTESGEYVDELYCVACNKSFKNTNAFANHEESKKHRENVERLRLEMDEEEESFIGVEEMLNNVQLNGISDNDDEELDEELDNDCSDIEEESDAPLTVKTKHSKKDKKTKKANSKLSKLDSDVETEDKFPDFVTEKKLVDSSDTEDWSTNKKSGKKNKSKKQTNNSKRDNSTKLDKVESKEREQKDIPSTLPDDDHEAQASEHVCVTCKSTFESKNKLFAHLKKTNHGVYIPKEKPVVECKPSKAKNKRK